MGPVVLPWTKHPFLLLIALRKLGLRQDSRNWHNNPKSYLSKLRNVTVGKMLWKQLLYLLIKCVCMWEAGAGSRAGCDRRPPEETCMANGSREGKGRCSPKGWEMWLWHTWEGGNLERSERGELRSSNIGRQFPPRAKHKAKEMGEAQTSFFLLSLCPLPSSPTPYTCRVIQGVNKSI